MRKLLCRKHLARYGTVRVFDTMYEGEEVRFLTAGRSVQSASFLSPDRRCELVFDYMKEFDWALHIRPDIKRTLLLGGGAFQYPKHYLCHYPDKEMDVVELRGSIARLALRYFFLSECLETYGRGRLRIYIGDGLTFLKKRRFMYDLIINDAFVGFAASGGLQSVSGLKEIKEHLHEGGLYLINLAAARKGPASLKAGLMKRRLRQVFRYVLELPADEARCPFEAQNLLLFASDKELMTERENG